MRVLLVNNVCATGGVEAQMASLARGLAARGHDVTAYFYNGGEGVHLFDGICEVITSPDATLGEVICTNKFDIIHTNLTTLGIGFLKTLRRVGYRKGVVVTCHGAMVGGWTVPSRAFALTAVSDYVASELEETLATRPQTVYNGIDTGVFRPDGPAMECDSPVLLWVGRPHDPDKDFAGFTACAARMAGMGWSAMVVGGDSEDKYNTLSTWMPGRCRTLHNLSASEMAEVYRGVALSGGCLLSTSQREAFGLVVAEAMACGCPAIVPRIGGLPEVVADGVTGFVYDREGGMEAAVEKVLSLSDSGMRSKIVNSASRDVIQRFSSDLMVDSYCVIYADVALTSDERHSPARTVIAGAGLRTLRLVRRLRGSARL